jgi:hypothetical protein
MKITLPDGTVIEGTEEEIQRVLARLPVPCTEVIGHPWPTPSHREWLKRNKPGPPPTSPEEYRMSRIEWRRPVLGDS